ncbi:transcription initiation protein SPT3 homolog [Anneissia japonica]|uniref:transcription initiation protein SPT3 homolog n=1 Tax=Anneissia japonica TaxID=1529436 RepID=UPI001425879A|nr:transcription initiation protein SPT3 homolog [Anneissia japonica]XP_033125681.1 transcription initiation protein SPT3 homolog [Anneissia japonica]
MPHLCQVSNHARGSSRVNFATEIQAMMYALGDCRKPLRESALLVEAAVQQKMLSILNKSAQICISRGGRFIGIEDFLYLMRLDRVRLRRLLRFLSFKDNKLLKTLSDEEDPSESAFGVDSKPTNTSKRQRIAYEFLSMIDQTGEFVSLFEDDGIDQVKQERLERVDEMTKKMDSASYQDFSESRQVNFYKKIAKFKEWVVYSELEPKPNSSAIEVLTYLAYETVAEIVDLSLYVRRDMNSAFLEPNDKLSAPKFVNSGICAGQFQMSHMKSHSKKASDQASPPASPSSSLVSPSITSSNNFASLAGSTNQSQTEFAQPSDIKTGSTLGKAKAKKRKKASGPSPYEVAVANALQPHHIREAIRRFWNRSEQMGF